MPAPSTVEEFLDLVRRSGVIEEKRLGGLLERLRSQSLLGGNPRSVADQLIQEGVLTPFQVEQLLQGRWRRFTIGKYKVLERLGSGGMGSVYLCEHTLMRRRVALKVLPASRAKDSSSLERFYREARAVAALDHPNIVRAYDIDSDDNLHFLVMEHVDGSSLQEMVKRSGTGMDPIRAAHYIRQAALGLQHAHEAAGLVHRDIKPGNILVDRNGIVKILDMGLARFFHDEEDPLTRKYDENILGTADYLSPEQAIDSHMVDIRSDIYSLGGTFYYCLTGKTPFTEGSVAQKLIWHQQRHPKPISEYRSDVPSGLIAIVEKMMAKHPDHRFQTPQEVADALAPWTQTPIPPPPDHEMPQLSLAATRALNATGDPSSAGRPSDSGSGMKLATSGSGTSTQVSAGVAIPSPSTPTPLPTPVRSHSQTPDGESDAALAPNHSLPASARSQPLTPPLPKPPLPPPIGVGVAAQKSALASNQSASPTQPSPAKPQPLAEPAAGGEVHLSPPSPSAVPVPVAAAVPVPPPTPAPPPTPIFHPTPVPASAPVPATPPVPASASVPATPPVPASPLVAPPPSAVTSTATPVTPHTPSPSERQPDFPWPEAEPPPPEADAPEEELFVPPPALTSRSSNRAASKRSRPTGKTANKSMGLFWPIVGGSVLVATALVLLVVVVYSNTGRPEKPVRPPIRITAASAGGLTLALRNALDGDRIIIETDITEADVNVSKKNITIEGAQGKSITWRSPPNMPATAKLLNITGAEGLLVRNLTFDGENRGMALIQIYSKCDGLKLENLELTGIRQYGLLFATAAGSREAPMLVHNVRILTSHPDSYAIGFWPAKHATISQTSHLAFRELSISGPGRKLVQRLQQVSNEPPRSPVLMDTILLPGGLTLESLQP